MDKKTSSAPMVLPQLWGGPECTINRVSDFYKDQLQLTGHYERTGDIECFGKLGIKALRYPFLWERHQPEEDGTIDFTWAAQQLKAMQENSIMPVAGLVHHGSGPRYTNLMQASFATGLAEYGYQFAKRFPWVEYYTPVNEPLTTARFSGLYGFWYPHKQDTHSFATMLLNQLKATVLTMQAIRSVNPQAKLVQTEDLAKIHSTPLLQYQAAFENERRWLTYDVLCGKVNNKHAMYRYFISNGIPERDLRFFIENPCPPDMLGLNYYITSERYLDENIFDYPVYTHGGNDTHRYADTEAVRTGHRAGLSILLKEVWDRYHIPLVMTEVHIGCTWDEQLRWFKQVWDSCAAAIGEGIDIRAVTAWALLGSYDWHNLLTRDDGCYEAGVYDSHSGTLYPTPLVRLIASLAQGRECYHDIIKQEGWWQKQGCLFPHLRKSIPEWA